MVSETASNSAYVAIDHGCIALNYIQPGQNSIYTTDLNNECKYFAIGINERTHHKGNT